MKYIKIENGLSVDYVIHLNELELNNLTRILGTYKQSNVMEFEDTYEVELYYDSLDLINKLQNMEVDKNASSN